MANLMINKNNTKDANHLIYRTSYGKILILIRKYHKMLTI